MADTMVAADALEGTEPDIFELFESDPEAEEKGVWLMLGRSRFRVRSVTCREVQRVREAQQRRQARIVASNGGRLPDYLVDANDVELSGALVTEWENVPDPDTRTGMMACTPENKRRLFSAKALKGLKTRIWAFALEAENFRRAEQERMEGNSVTSSAGS